MSSADRCQAALQDCRTAAAPQQASGNCAELPCTARPRPEHLSITRATHRKSLGSAPVHRKSEHALRHWRTTRNRGNRLTGNPLHFDDPLQQFPGFRPKCRTGRRHLRLPAQQPFTETTVFGVVCGRLDGLLVLRYRIGIVRTIRPSAVLTNVATARLFAGFHVGNPRFHVTANTQPVRQRVRPRMPQQRKDAPDRQHDETDNTHERDSIRTFC